MKITVLKRAVLENIPSASGVEIIDGVIYVMGDDSPYLYRLDHGLKLLEKVLLFESKDFEGGRIPKSIKPDLECITPLTINNNKYLLLLGSGSAENRDKGYLVKLPTKYNRKHVVQPVSFTGLYNLLRSNPEISENGLLNLEGAATGEAHIILFNRANKAGINTALCFNLEEFIVYLTENPDLIPFPQIYQYTLPAIEGVPSGFSGAAVMNNKLVFTAAAEDTDDPIADGKVTGSLVGYIDLLPVDYMRGGSMKVLSEIKDHAFITEGDTLYRGKVESITLHEMEGESKYIAIVVTDDDQGGSELLMLEIEI